MHKGHNSCTRTWELSVIVTASTPTGWLHLVSAVLCKLLLGSAMLGTGRHQASSFGMEPVLVAGFSVCTLQACPVGTLPVTDTRCSIAAQYPFDLSACIMHMTGFHMQL